MDFRKNPIRRKCDHDGNGCMDRRIFRSNVELCFVGVVAIVGINLRRLFVSDSLLIYSGRVRLPHSFAVTRSLVPSEPTEYVSDVFLVRHLST